jgi:hypothetical protein
VYLIRAQGHVHAEQHARCWLDSLICISSICSLLFFLRCCRGRCASLSELRQQRCCMYFRCGICRVSVFKAGHIRCEKHRQALQAVLGNMQSKLEQARKACTCASLEDDANCQKPTAKLWCYFCQQEVQIHTCVSGVQVTQAGAIEHFGSSSHRIKVGNFFKEQDPGSDWTVDKFFLLEYDVDQFDRHLQRLLEQYIATLAAKQQQSLMDLTVQSAVQNDFHTPPSTLQEAPFTGVSPARLASRSPSTSLLAISASKLTVLKPHALRQGEVNVHTPDHIPPWLSGSVDPMNRVCSSEEEVKHCGPSMEEFVRARQLRNMRITPPSMRTLRSTDRGDVSDPASFLPDFGGVWHQQSRAAYRRRFDSVSAAHATEHEATNAVSSQSKHGNVRMLQKIQEAHVSAANNVETASLYTTTRQQHETVHGVKRSISQRREHAR